MHFVIYEDELYHHGIKGQKWGVKNGPPYPLDDSDHSFAEKAGVTAPKHDGKDIAKKVLLVAGGAAVVGVGSYVAYKYISNGNVDPSKLAEALNERIKRGDISANPDVLINKQILESFTDEERRATQYYTTPDAYKIVNQTLRGKDANYIKENNSIGLVGQQILDYNLQGKLIDDMTSALNKSKLDRDVTTTRMTDITGVCGLLGINEKGATINDLMNSIGTNVTEKGFFSSSPGNPKTYFGNIKLTTLCPKGTKAFYYGGLSEISSEQELLLQRSTQFKVLDVRIPTINGNLSGSLKGQDGIEIILEVIDQLKGD